MWMFLYAFDMHSFTIGITTEIRSLVRGYGGRDGFPQGRGNRMCSYGETGGTGMGVLNVEGDGREK